MGFMWTDLSLPDPAAKIYILIDSVEQCEKTIERATSDLVEKPLPAPMRTIATKVLRDVQLRLMIPVLELQNVLAQVRIATLEWALALSEQGIHGEGLSFDDRDRERASHIHIEYMTAGVVGSMSGGTVQVGDYASIHHQLCDAGIPQEERNKLENLLEELSSTDGTVQQGLTERAGAWFERNLARVKNLGALGLQLKNLFGD